MPRRIRRASSPELEKLLGDVERADREEREREYASRQELLSARRLRLRGVLVLLLLALAVVLSYGGDLEIASLAFGRPREGGAKYEWQSEGWYPSPRGGTVTSWEESYSKAAALVRKMSLIEKVNVTSGIGWAQGMCLGNTGPAVNVGFPSLCLQDGPLGLRFADNTTAFPAALTAGATWNRALMRARGAAHGAEARGKGVNVILGPAMGPLGRMPAGGRNWEGFGPDPYLQGIAAAETIRGIQSQHVIATAKHFILNEQEHFRQIREWEESFDHAISSNVDDRTLHELYLWPFAESVRAGVGSVMCSYNQVNNTYACGNSKILNGILKDELGFQGFVQSDWWAQRDGVHSVLAGLDVTMPGTTIQNFYHTLFGSNLTAAVMNASIPLGRLDDMVTRVVAAWYRMGQDDPQKFPADGPNFSSWTYEEEDFLHHDAGEGSRGIVNKYVDVRADHWRIARAVAVEGTVLVKNENNILPLSRTGFRGKKLGIYGEDAGDDDRAGFPNFCKDRGCNVGSLGTGWGSGAVDYTHFHTPLTSLRGAFNTSTPEDRPEISYITDNKALLEIRKSAREQDLCFAFINSDAGEGYIQDPVTGVHGDRLHLYAQKGGDMVVKTVAENCQNTIVVIHAVGPVLVERWVDLPGVKAVVLAHLPAQESGEALAEVLFGDANPSGKLPYTVAKRPEDYGPHSGILSHPNAETPQQTFHEKLEIDYRYFDAHSIEPRYEFGFGLSYTKFSFHSPKIRRLKLKTPFPDPRPELLDPPHFDSKLPEAKDVLFPEGFRKYKHYNYPYLTSEDELHGRTPLPPPRDHDVSRPLSPAGGGEGGNPSLWDVIVEVEVTVRNDGGVRGAEVVQLYVSFPADARDESGEKIEFPVKALRGFEKVELEKGESKKVRMGLTRKDLSYWDVKAQNWRMVTEGKYNVWVGNSSRNLPVKVVF